MDCEGAGEGEIGERRVLVEDCAEPLVAEAVYDSEVNKESCRYDEGISRGQKRGKFMKEGKGCHGY